MKRLKEIGTCMLGGSVAGILLGILVGGILGVAYGLFQGNVSFGLAGALLGGLCFGCLGSGYGLWMGIHEPADQGDTSRHVIRQEIRILEHHHIPSPGRE